VTTDSAGSTDLNGGVVNLYQSGGTSPFNTPGTYKLKAWHERLPADEKEITVPASGEIKVDFTLGIKNLPQY